MQPEKRGLAIVTGASTGIGYELAKCCANHGFDPADHRRRICHHRNCQLRSTGVTVDAIEADLATIFMLRLKGDRWRCCLPSLAAIGRNSRRGAIDALAEREPAKRRGGGLCSVTDLPNGLVRG
jgi:NAD(P)-dependent dehydrogenase (short-subunit alcohol dehydrogenase family)